MSVRSLAPLLLLLLGCRPPAPEPPEPPATPATYLFLGDSLTDGDGVADSLNFVSLLAERWPDRDVQNGGRSGWSTEAYLRRWDEVDAALPDRAEAVFIQLGANDLRVFGHADATVTQTTDRMAEILRRLRARFPEARLVLMAPPTMDVPALDARMREAGFGTETPRALADLRDAYRALAQTEGTGFIDLYDALPPGHTLDGAHPTPEGHSRIADRIASALERSALERGSLRSPYR